MKLAQQSTHMRSARAFPMRATFKSTFLLIDVKMLCCVPHCLFDPSQSLGVQDFNLENGKCFACKSNRDAAWNNGISPSCTLYRNEKELGLRCKFLFRIGSHTGCRHVAFVSKSNLDNETKMVQVFVLSPMNVPCTLHCFYSPAVLNKKQRAMSNICMERDITYRVRLSLPTINLFMVTCEKGPSSLTLPTFLSRDHFKCKSLFYARFG